MFSFIKSTRLKIIYNLLTYYNDTMELTLELIHDYAKWSIHGLIHPVWLSIRLNNLIEGHNINWTKKNTESFLDFFPFFIVALLVKELNLFLVLWPIKSMCYTKNIPNKGLFPQLRFCHYKSRRYTKTEAKIWQIICFSNCI